MHSQTYTQTLYFSACRLSYVTLMMRHQSVMMVFRGSAEILGFGSEEEFPRFPRFRWLPRLQLNKRAMIRGVLRNENSTTCGRDDNFIDLR
ncbi:hypothetical protein PoB_006774700 [Plakobranchus ocellatus]|uniref:Uncharacterized protein n=1 Tax=Plakobranchus ocellatus TaxID=259542 RepID=A0AAV4DB38_9GAST|nr:hypothetical protein PoB_006774700 [Plakobranchus ocellatus]